MSKNMAKNVFLKEVNEDKLRLDFYEEKLKNKEVFEIKFSLADKTGNLYMYEGGVRVQLDNFGITGLMYKTRYRAHYLAQTFPVAVNRIDRERKIVHVSHRDARAITKEELKEELDLAIEKNEPLTVVARLVAIKGDFGKSYAIVDLGGVGITGIIRMKDWSIAFTSDIKLVAKIGDIFKVVVKKHIRWNGEPAYGCSRAEALGFNPWSGIEEKLPKNTLVNVLCIHKTPKNFFGKIEGIDEINAYCEYPDQDKNIEILEGATYQGYVAKVNEATKLLRIRIFKKVD